MVKSRYVQKLAVWLAFCILTGMASACAPTVQLPPAPKEGAALFPAPLSSPYRLQVGDVLDIKVRFNPELNEQVLVPPDGIISTSIASHVVAYGKTLKEFEKQLNKLYRKELKRPRVSVVMRTFAPNRVYVAGEVQAPGEFVTAGPNLTLLKALARAGGLKPSAGESNIIIIRQEEGGAKAYSVNYAGAVSGEDPQSDVILAPYDVVFVPRSGVADVYLYFQQFVQQFVPLTFGLSYQLNPRATVNQ